MVYGVMAAQVVLDHLVLVRVQVDQRKIGYTSVV